MNGRIILIKIIQNNIHSFLYERKIVSKFNKNVSFYIYSKFLYLFQYIDRFSGNVITYTNITTYQ